VFWDREGGGKEGRVGESVEGRRRSSESSEDVGLEGFVLGGGQPSGVGKDGASHRRVGVVTLSGSWVEVKKGEVELIEVSEFEL